MNAVIHLTKAVKFKPQKCQSCFHIFLCSSNIWLRAQEEHTNYFARHISILEQTCSAKIGWQIFVNQSELISIATTIFYKMAAALARCTRSSGFPRRKDLWSFCFVAIVRIMVYYDLLTFFCKSLVSAAGSFSDDKPKVEIRIISRRCKRAFLSQMRRNPR